MLDIPISYVIYVMTRDNLKAKPEVEGIKKSPKRICSLESFKVNGRLLSKILHKQFSAIYKSIIS